MSFKEQVEKELEKLSREQLIEFAWRCAVRVLPFLGHKGHFDFWEHGLRQKHLYAILSSIDWVAAHNAVPDNGVYDSVRNLLHETVIYHAAAAIHDARDTNNRSFFKMFVSPAEYAVLAAEGLKIDLRHEIFQDIGSINNNQQSAISLEIYGKNWDNFQQALKNEGCEYWGKLYQDIFKNNFKINEKALKRRLNVPKEIQEQGAAEVARHLEKIEKEGAERLNEARIIILGEKGAGKPVLQGD